MRRGTWTLALLLAACGGEGGSGDGDPPPPTDAAVDEGDARPPVDATAADAGDAAPDAAACACTGRQVCVDGACVEPEACMGHEDCLAPRACVDGSCRDGCAGDADCPRALRCDVAARDCVEATPCEGDEGCFEGRVCTTGRCADPEVGCAGDGDCGEGRVCRGGACVDLGCGEDADCGGAQRCVEGECVESPDCGRDEDCLGDRVCIGGTCADPCGMNGCSGALACDRATGRCEEAVPCAGDDGCLPGRVCAAGVCAAPCVEAADCPGAQRCADGRCVEPAVCNRPEDCLEGRVCDAGACRDGCARAGCPGSLVCDDASGACMEASPCRDDAGCRDGRRCVDGACADPCGEDADCAGAQRCVDGRCEPPPRCFGDADCGPVGVCGPDLRCTRACDAERPCPGTQVCGDGLCAEGDGCAADRDCLGARRCHPAARACVDPCVAGGCAGGQVCGADGLCGEAGGCDDDAQCLGERQCLFGACRDVRCRGDAECPAGERCVDFACRADVPGACACPAGWACADGRCTPPGPCAGDGDCGGGGHCLDGRCVACGEDGDCPGATSCRAGVCVEPDRCAQDAACLPGRICEEFGACAPDFDGCPDDALENADADAAIPLAAGVYGDLRACEASDDWFRVAGEGALLVVVRAERPLGLALFDVGDPFTAIEADAGYGGESWIAAPAGEYLVRVSASRGASGAYQIDVRDGLACADDRFERPWRNDDQARAAPVGAGVHRATICGDDADWFAYTGAGAARLRIDGPARTDVAADLAPGARFRVTGDDGARYAVVIEPVRDPVGRCEDAPLVRGDIDASFADGPDDFADPCLGGPGRADRVFRVEMAAPGDLSARLEGPVPMVAMALHAACDQAPLACTGGAGGLDVPGLAAGTYYLVVEGPIQGRLVVDATAGFLCEDAPVLVAGRDEPVMLAEGPDGIAGNCIGGETAVFRFTLDAPSDVVFSARGDAQMSVAVRRTCDDPSSELACGNGFTATARAAALDAGDWYAVVGGDGAATVRLETTPAGAAPEAADACDGAPVALSAGDRLVIDGDTAAAADDVDATRCNREAGGRDRVLRFRLAAPAHIEATLAANGFDGYLMLLDGACGGAPTCGTALNPSLGADLRAGEYALVVDGQRADAAGPFRLTVTAR